MSYHNLKNFIDKEEKLVSQNLFTSDFYHIKRWNYDLLSGNNSMPGFNDCLCIMYVNKGNYLSDIALKEYEMYSGYILLEKPDCEYKLKASEGESTIINFTGEFYQQLLSDNEINSIFFFTNKQLLSVIIKSIPEIDYLHFQIITRIDVAGKLEMDNLVIEFFNSLVHVITNCSLKEKVASLLKVNRLATVELAKDYMNKNFMRDISLQEVSINSFISPFHFSRIFKSFTAYSPHQYLQNIRLKHSEMLLKNTSMSVAEIAASSGFTSTAYFATAYKQKYKINPLKYRKEYFDRNVGLNF